MLFYELPKKEPYRHYSILKGFGAIGSVVLELVVFFRCKKILDCMVGGDVTGLHVRAVFM